MATTAPSVRSKRNCPIALQVQNRDFANWEERMSPWPVEADVPEVHLPRPGHADVLEYQVAQTERGADVRVVGPPDLDAAGLERAIAARLAALGLDAPVATVAVVASLERLASGKLKRFVALRA